MLSSYVSLSLSPTIFFSSLLIPRLSAFFNLPFELCCVWTLLRSSIRLSFCARTPRERRSAKGLCCTRASVCVCMCMYVCVCVCMCAHSLCLYFLPFLSLFFSYSVYLSIYLSIYLSVYLSIYLSIYQFSHLYIYISPVYLSFNPLNQSVSTFCTQLLQKIAVPHGLQGSFLCSRSVSFTPLHAR